MTIATLPTDIDGLMTRLLLEDQTLGGLADIYNAAAAHLPSYARVTRFSDRAAGERRVRNIHTDLLANEQAYKAWAAKELLGDLVDAPAVEKPVMAKYVGAPIVAQVAQTIRDGAAKRKQHPLIKSVSSSDHATTEITPETVAHKSQGVTFAEALAAESVSTTSLDKGLISATIRRKEKAKADTPPVPLTDKEREMPVLRLAAKAMCLKPKPKAYPRKAGSKQALLVDLLSGPEGVTFSEIYDALAATGKPWKGVTIRSGLAWDINHLAGYGVSSDLLNGEEFATEGRMYEANRLKWNTPEYDPKLKLAVYRLTYPKGLTAPLPHITKKDA